MKTRILASAGTGKTYQLTTRYLARVREGAPPESILATTFTRKAAGEILERVLTRLAEAALEPQKLMELGRSMDDFALHGSAAAPFGRQECDALLDRVCGNLDHVAISTLDSFFLRLCRAFPFETDLPPGVQPEEPGSMVDQALRRQALHLTLEDPETGAVGPLLEDLLRGRATRAIFAEMLGVVGDGYNLFRDAPPEAWQATPVPERPDDGAVRDGIARIEALAAAEANGSWRKALAADAERAALRQWREFLTKGLAPKILADAPYYRREVPAEVKAAYAPVIARACFDLLDAADRQTRATYELLRRFHRHYRRLLRRHRILLFSEAPRALAGTDAIRDAALVAYRMGASVEHLLLDEFQDTSPEQWEILLPFARHCTTAADAPRSFFCVGDLKQAIYAFRGGTSEILARIPRVLSGIEEQDLNSSRRSSPRVLEAVNRLFGGIAANSAIPDGFGPVAADWQSGFREHQAHHRGRPGYVALVTSPAASPVAEGSGEEESTASIGHLHFVAERIREIAGKAPWAEIGILMRTNAGVQRMLDALRQAGVDASGEGAGRVDDDPAVELILSALTLADHPGHTAAALHVANAPVAFEEGVGREIEGNARATADLALRIRRRLLEEGYARVIAGWAILLAPYGDARTAARLSQLVELADAFRTLTSLRPSDFVAFAREAGVDDPTRARIRAMTIHGSKGLEFDVVVLPELDNGLYSGRPPRFLVHQETPVDPIRAVYRNPGSPLTDLVEEMRECVRLGAASELRDALCLLYVAMTRPRHALHLFVEPVETDSHGQRKARRFSNAAILCAGLPAPGTEEDPAGGQVLYENGDPEWHLQVPEAEKGRPAPSSKHAPAPEIFLKKSGARPPRNLTRIAPSTLSRHDDAGAPWDVRDSGSRKAADRGIALHALLQQVGWAGEALPAEADLLRVVRGAIPGAEEALCRQLLAELHAILARPVVAQALARPAESVLLWRERSFAVSQPPDLLRGTFDRVVVWRDGDRFTRAEVTDFKTDSIGPGQVGERVERYREQILSYRRALAKMLGIPPEKVAARLLFTSVPELVTLD